MQKKKKARQKLIYEAREGSPFHRGDAQAIGEFIARIPEKSTANILKAIEEHPKHVIHKYIEWDDTRAGKRYRLSQVRSIVNHIYVRIVSTENSMPVRAFFSVKEDEETEPIYVDIKTTFTDEFTRSQVIGRAKRELDNWRERYAVYNEFKPIINAIASFLGVDENNDGI